MNNYIIYSNNFKFLITHPAEHLHSGEVEVVALLEKEAKRCSHIVIPKNVSQDSETYHVTSIGHRAFEGCSSLVSIIIPPSVTVIKERAFAHCRGLKSIEIPSSVTSIGYGAFEGCSNLESIEIPSSVTSIGYGAFEGCSSLANTKVKYDNPSSDDNISSSNRRNAENNWPSPDKISFGIEELGGAPPPSLRQYLDYLKTTQPDKAWFEINEFRK